MPFNADSRPTNLQLQTDAELVRALKAGQPSALGILYDRHTNLVYRLALRILANPQEAEDLTQEIFLTLWRKDIYNPTRGSLGSFLTTLTRSRAIDRLRSRGTNLKFLQTTRDRECDCPMPAVILRVTKVLHQSAAYLSPGIVLEKPIDRETQDQPLWAWLAENLM